VAQRALRESNEYSNDERENDSLTKALQTKESNEVVFVVFLIRWPGRRVFQNTNLCTRSRK
jgi:hypothetical protein